MGVNATSVISSVADPSADPTTRVPSQTLGQDDFLKLLVAQMTTQDPMNPMGNTEFIAQMAQFTSLEQSRTMANTMATMNQQQQVLQANELIGRQVSLVDDNLNVVSGVVTGVVIGQDSPMIVVDGQGYSLASVVSVTLPQPVAAPDPTVPPEVVPAPEPQTPVSSVTSN